MSELQFPEFGRRRRSLLPRPSDPAAWNQSTESRGGESGPPLLQDLCTHGLDEPKCHPIRRRARALPWLRSGLITMHFYRSVLRAPTVPPGTSLDPTRGTQPTEVRVSCNSSRRKTASKRILLTGPLASPNLYIISHIDNI